MKKLLLIMVLMPGSFLIIGGCSAYLSQTWPGLNNTPEQEYLLLERPMVGPLLENGEFYER